MATPFDSIGGLLGIDPEQLKQLMAALGPQEEDRKSANMQALTQLGLGLLGTRKGYEWEQLGNAGQNALMARQQAMQGAQAGRMDQVKMAEQLAKLKAGQDSAKARQLMNNEIGALLQGGGQAQGGDASPAAAKWQIYLQAAEKAALGGDMAAAKHWAELAEKHKPKFSTTPHVGLKDGKAGNYVLDDMGNEKPLGFAPPPKFREMTDNKTTRLVNEYQVPESGLSMTMQTTPNNDQSTAATIRGQNMVDARSREGNAIARDGTIAGKVGEFRKEFNSLPQVKAYGEVQPVLQSAREAVGTDTAAADLNLIYAAAKIMDPTSVVRESETQMVVGSGSPAQRFMGQFNYVAGGGRLTPAARRALMAEVESRGRGYESGYKAARKAYEGIATKNGIPTDQVFIEPFAGSAAAPAPPSAGPQPGAIVGGYRFKGGDPNKRENWVKV